ncbi:hypothetical protein RJ035_005433 [Blastomyces gilchristii]
MPSVQTIQLFHVPSNCPVHIALYRDLENASFLREQLFSGNTEFEYAFIDAATILSTTHLLAAVFRAVNDHQNNRLKSKNVHSEIIAESFRKFGLTDTTKDLLVVKVSTSPEVTNASVAQHLEKVIKGISLNFDNDNLRLVSDIGKIRKAYKLGSGNVNQAPKVEAGKAGQKSSKTPAGIEMRDLERTILGLMALRGS